MLRLVVRRWSAWAPGIETRQQWLDWFDRPVPPPSAGNPDAKFLPAMLRRRCTPLTKIMLTAAFECCDPDELCGMRTVFASRHGSINESIALLESIAANGRVSAATFSHTVHNAQAGLFSIAARNRNASSSIAARGDTFPSALLEAAAHLERAPEDRVLVVIGDVPLAARFAGMVEEAAWSYAVALQIARTGEGLAFTMEVAERQSPVPGSDPPPLRFLHWLESERKSLILSTEMRAWCFRRIPCAGRGADRGG